MPHSARIWNYWLGGKDNYAVDRKAGDQYKEIFPGIAVVARSSRGFLTRAVRYLAGEAGLRQFLDIGTGLPTANNTHEVAQAIAPEARVVYVDNDPVVLAHARALLSSSRGGAIDYVHADVRDPETILTKAAETLDFAQPIAVMTLMILQYVPDADHPHQLVRRIMDAVPAGSYLTISDTTRDIDTARVAGTTSQLNARMPTNLHLRSRTEIAGFLDGLDLVAPGLVPLPEWRARPEPGHIIPCYAGIGRKP